MDKQYRKLEKVLCILGLDFPGANIGEEEIIREEIGAIKKAIGNSILRVYESTNEASERENLSEFDALIIDSSDDRGIKQIPLEIRYKFTPDFFSLKFREANPDGYVIAFSVEKEYLNDGLSRRLYDETIVTFLKTNNELTEALKSAFKRGGFKLG